MKNQNVHIALTAATLLLSASLSCALENNLNAEQEATDKARASHNVSKSYIDAKREARRKDAVRIKPVDINIATGKQLQKLPGVTDVVAKKIIAGRPYVSNIDLLTRNVINKEIYDNIKRRIFVKPGNRSAVKKSAINKQK